ncbi:MAG: hypothetical protein HYW01_10505 [Deltaproteobacteria bacterium]|nr:hypothetical protein [Deltaproteobacteria bacterium]
MQIVKIESCQVRENPNFEKMKEGREFVSVIFLTEQGNHIYVDLAYTAKGTMKIHILPIRHGNNKTYDKTIEIKLSDGTTVLDDLRVLD